MNRYELKMKWQKNMAEGSEIFEAYHDQLVDEWNQLTIDLIELYKGNGRSRINIRENLEILLEDILRYRAGEEQTVWDELTK